MLPDAQPLSLAAFGLASNICTAETDLPPPHPNQLHDLHGVAEGLLELADATARPGCALGQMSGGGQQAGLGSDGESHRSENGPPIFLATPRWIDSAPPTLNPNAVTPENCTWPEDGFSFHGNSSLQSDWMEDVARAAARNKENLDLMVTDGLDRHGEPIHKNPAKRARTDSPGRDAELQFTDRAYERLPGPPRPIRTMRYNRAPPRTRQAAMDQGRLRQHIPPPSPLATVFQPATGMFSFRGPVPSTDAAIPEEVEYDDDFYTELRAEDMAFEMEAQGPDGGPLLPDEPLAASTPKPAEPRERSVFPAEEDYGELAQRYRVDHPQVQQAGEPGAGQEPQLPQAPDVFGPGVLNSTPRRAETRVPATEPAAAHPRDVDIATGCPGRTPHPLRNVLRGRQADTARLLGVQTAPRGGGFAMHPPPARPGRRVVQEPDTPTRARNAAPLPEPEQAAAPGAAASPPRPAGPRPEAAPEVPRAHAGAWDDEEAAVDPMAYLPHDMAAAAAREPLADDAQTTRPGCVFTWTKRPEGGFPRRHRDDPLAPILGLAAVKQAKWFSNDEYKIHDSVLLELHNGGVPHPESTESLIKRVEDALEGILGRRGLKATGARRPSAWIVGALTWEEVAELTEFGTYSIKGGPELTFHISPLTLLIPGHLCRLQGYGANNLQSIQDSVRATIGSERVRALIRPLVAENPTFRLDDVEAAVQKIVDSAHAVVTHTPTGSIRVSAFCRTPTRDVVKWRAWKKAVCSRPFDSADNAPGVPMRAIPCYGCKGADHDRDACPFLTIPGWNGPKAPNGTNPGRPDRTAGPELAGRPHRPYGRGPAAAAGPGARRQPNQARFWDAGNTGARGQQGHDDGRRRGNGGGI
ncbi:hypothetical protein K466DRAFT_599191 [Polyporus arcularius HHB13444]|uniref:Uncharacterized protein n=1 Tax=Polyporus arcularius HHB13444 TaxID=1314778 RepID=A0A5C3PGP8_9APHY|nr:hypothetical protein K466DRAFT_599191 [Polyporus arcularius HHB13444]